VSECRSPPAKTDGNIAIFLCCRETAGGEGIPSDSYVADDRLCSPNTLLHVMNIVTIFSLLVYVYVL